MLLKLPLSNLEKKYSIEEGKHLHSGSCGKIFSDKGDFIKIPHDFHKGSILNDRFSQERLYNEAKIQDLAVDLGIKLPKVYGLFAVKEKKSGIYYPGMAMRELGDVLIGKLSGSLREEAERQKNFEINKAEELGFVINDVHDMNAVWFPKEEQVYLLDCGLWGYQGELVA